MDILKSLNLEDLPEQQTRTSQLTDSEPDFNLKLGFDACCLCGKTKPKVKCVGCKRVKYCSEKCMKQDSVPPDDEEEQALGHSSIICALLCACTDDELVEEQEGVESPSNELNEGRRNAAIDRVVSEFESYPATLSNVIMDGPCYQETLKKCTGGELEIHVVGAGIDSELWFGHPEKTQEREVYKYYAEALAEIGETYKLRTIQLRFVGPECPKKDMSEIIPIPQTKSKLQVNTIREKYSKGLLKKGDLNQPDIVVFFNPGFTCPDYEWEEALSTVKGGTPYLVSTNTELEGIADIQYLLDRAFITDVPPGLANILETGASSEGDDDDNETFFSVNPFCGYRVRQSGTMANDLYVKSRWIFGGRFGKPLIKDSSKSNKKRKVEGSGNTKKSNPALV